jgi:hypothetical protein
MKPDMYGLGGHGSGGPAPREAQGGGGGNGIADMIRMSMMMGVSGLTGHGSGGGMGMRSLISLLTYETLSRYSPLIVNSTIAYIQKKWAASISANAPTTAMSSVGKAIVKALPSEPTAKITCMRFYDASKGGNATLNRVDAVLHVVCSLPHAKELSYNGSDYVPGFKERIQVSDDVYFRLLNKDEDTKGIVSGIRFELSSYNHDVQHIQRFVDEASVTLDLHVKNKLGRHLYYFDHITNAMRDSMSTNLPRDMVVFRKSVFNTNRTFDNMFFEDKEAVINRIRLFLTNKDWYAERGIPHALGAILSGPPGCGKTSLVKGTAAESRRHILNIHLSDVKTKQQLKNLFFDENLMVYDPNSNRAEQLVVPIADRLFLVEDIDAMKSVVLKRSVNPQSSVTAADTSSASEETYGDHVRRRARGTDAMSNGEMQSLMDGRQQMLLPGMKKKEEDPIDLSTLLNILDGTYENPGRMIFVTTNYPERLDDALVRPGRMDMIVQFKEATTSCLREQFINFYRELVADTPDSEFDDDRLNLKWTPAEVNQIMFQNLRNPHQALKIMKTMPPQVVFPNSHRKPVAIEDAPAPAPVEKVTTSVPIAVAPAPVAPAPVAPAPVAPAPVPVEEVTTVPAPAPVEMQEVVIRPVEMTTVPPRWAAAPVEEEDEPPANSYAAFMKSLKAMPLKIPEGTEQYYVVPPREMEPEKEQGPVELEGVSSSDEDSEGGMLHTTSPVIFGQAVRD